MASAVAVLTNAALLRRVVLFVDGVPLVLLELERALPPDEWSAHHGDAALVTRFAIRHDNRCLLQMLHDAQRVTTAAPRRRLRFEDALVWAMRVGELDTLGWLHASFPQLKAGAQLTDAAIKTGRVDVLDFLHAHLRAPFAGDSQALSCSLAFAPRDRWMAVAEWLARHGDDYAACFSMYVLERVLESGDAAMFAFVHARGHGATPSALSHLMLLAARAGNLPAVRLLPSDPRSARSMDTAAQHGHLEVVRYLHAERHAVCSKFAMDSAARNGFLNTVQFLHAHRPEGCTKAALSDAAERGHLAVVQFLAENRQEGDLEEALGLAQRSHQDAVAAFLQRAVESGETIDS